MPSGAPDYSSVIQTVAPIVGAGAPDYQETAVGPGGVPLSGGSSGGEWCPQDWGWCGWTCQPQITNGWASEENGKIFLVLAKATVTKTATAMLMGMGSVGTGIIAHENFLGIYNYVPYASSSTSYTLLGSTAAGAADSAFGSNTLSSVPLAAGVAVTAGTLYYIATLGNWSGTVGVQVGFQCTHLSNLAGQLYGLLSKDSHTTLPNPLTNMLGASGTGIPWGAFS